MADALEPGSRLGAFEVLEVLGQGGMGIVYKARDTRTGRLVAIKAVLPGIHAEEKYLRRFRREARAIASIAHPNIAVIHEQGEHDGAPFVVFELLTGGSLAQTLKKGPLPWREAASLGAAISRALAAVHARELVHRDVKPANILFDSEGSPKLGDFGLVRDTQAGRASGKLTGDGDLVGTLEFMAPEQADGPDATRAPADVYSLGATLYTAVTGRPVFEGSGIELITKHTLEAPIPPRTHVPELPEGFERLVVSMLEKEPAKRPSAATVAATLEELGRETRPRAPRSASRRGVVIAAGSVGVLLIAVALVVREGPKEPHLPPPPPAPVVPPRPLPPPAPRPSVPRPAENPAPRATLELKSRTTTLGQVFGTGALRHTDQALSIDLSRDGRLAVSGGLDRVVRVWSLPSGAPLKAVGPLSGAVRAVKIAPDARTAVACAAEPGELFVLDLEAGEIIARARTGPQPSFAFSPDGRTGLSCDVNGRVARHELSSLRIVDSRVTTASYRSVAISHDGRRAVLGVDPARLELVDVSALSSLGTFEVHRPRPAKPESALWLTGVAFSGDDETVAAASEGDALILWSVGKRATLREIGQEDWVTSVAFCADGTRLVTTNESGAVRVHDATTGAVLRELGRHEGVAWSAASSGERIATAGSDGAIRLWNLETPAEVVLGDRAHHGRITSLSADQAGHVLSTASDGTAFLWNGVGSATAERLELEGAPLMGGALFGAIGLAVAVDRTGVLHGWDLETRRPAWSRSVHPARLRAVCASTAGARHLVATGAEDGSIMLHEVSRAGSTSRALEPLKTCVRALSFDAEGGRLFACPEEYAVQVVDLKTGAVAETWRPVRNLVNAVIGLKEGTALVATQREVAEVGTPLRRLYLCPEDWVRTIALSPDESRLYSGNADGTVRIHDVGSRQELDVIDLGRLHDRASAIVVLPGGKSFLVGTERGLVLRFDRR